ncbi:ABC-three component system protein [Achromobacter sp. NPDC058515]|uniref:ABC-three component system protein n=1 Tax=Achromobacter sp. NPDC058515 TaxID=3346533 RepID=UPI00365E80B9
MTTSKKTPAIKKLNRVAVRHGAVPPSVQVQHFNEDQWEEFIEEACRHRPSGEHIYCFVKKLGGSGDGGRDVEARLVEQQMAGRWDLYQAKHYASGITPSVFFPELGKFFRNLLAGVYKPPRNYYLCAPKNAGNDLHNLFADPATFKETFLDAWEKGNTGFKNKTSLLTDDLKRLIDAFDFSRIRECLVRDLIEWHSKNKKRHYALFGIEAERGDDPLTPHTPDGSEMIYVSELLRVYEEHQGTPVSLADVLASDRYLEHFSDQRSYFYCAEGLKQFSRDIYGEDEFAAFLTLVQAGIRPWLNSLKTKTGLERLEDVLQGVNTLKLSDSVLAKRLRPNDLPGSCHHLANDKKVKWVK